MSTYACRASTAAVTCCGGWTRRASGTSASTRSTTSSAPGGCRRRSWSARAERTTLDLNTLTAMGVAPRRPTLDGARRPRAVLGRLAQRPVARRPQDGTPAQHVRRLGEGAGSRRAVASRATISNRRGCPRRRACSSTWRAARSARSSGRPAIRPDYSWLDVPVVDAKGHLRHDGGVVDSPGLYALALPVLRRRKSTFIYGIEDDARDVITHLATHLPTRHPMARICRACRSPIDVCDVSDRSTVPRGAALSAACRALGSRHGGILGEADDAEAGP